MIGELTPQSDAVVGLLRPVNESSFGVVNLVLAASLVTVAS